jgi:hypothetical protein
MDIYVLWAVIFFLACGAISAAVLYYYVKDSYTTIAWGTHVSLVFSIFICILPFPLLVIDVDAALSSLSEGASVSVADSWIAVWWMLIFFSTQIMAWGVLPIAQEYDGAGQFTPGARFKHAVKENIKMYIILGIISAVLMGYIFFLKGVTTVTGMVSLVMAMANSFGLVLLVIFLACGLLGVPKLLWHLSSPRLILAEGYRRVRQLHEELDIAKTEMTMIRSEVVRRDPLVDDAERCNLAVMLDEISMLEKFVPLSHTNVSTSRADTAMQGKNLVELNAELKRTIRICRRTMYQFRTQMKECLQLDRVVSGAENSKYWMVIRQPLLMILAIATGILTLLVMWSEIVVPFQTVTTSRISVVEIVVNNPPTRFIGCVLFLYYTAGCCYWAVFQFKVFDTYAVVPRVSDGASLCFIVTFLTRVLMPLCYHFLFMSDLTQSHTLVTYSRLFGNVDVVVFLGQWFNRFMPIFVPILAVLIELKVIHRLMQWIGVEGFETGIDSAIQRQQDEEEGRQIVGREMNTELRQINAGSPIPPTTPAEAKVAAAVAGVPAKKDPAVSKRYEDWKASRAAREGGAPPPKE